MEGIDSFDGPRFVQLHLLTSYPPSNLNRDDLGRPKTAVMGDVNRLRVSSQSLKRAWRTSDLFKDAMDGHLGVRTKSLGRKVYRDLRDEGVAREDAIDWAREIASEFASLDVTRKSDVNDVKDGEEDPAEAGILDTGQLFHLSPGELERVEDLAERIAERGEGPEEDELDILRERTNAVDVSMFGRMLADNPTYNVEAAVQVSHALTVHGVTVEDDFFTAVDDLNTDEDTGSGHMGELEFGSGVYYLYVCVNRHQLAANLGPEHQDLVDPAIQSLTEAAAKVAPEGKQATFGSRAYASYLMAEKGDQQPRSLSVAFLEPVQGQNAMAEAIEELEDQAQAFDRTYGDTAEDRARMDAHRGKGSLDQVLEFLGE